MTTNGTVPVNPDPLSQGLETLTFHPAGGGQAEESSEVATSIDTATFLFGGNVAGARERAAVQVSLQAAKGGRRSRRLAKKAASLEHNAEMATARSVDANDAASAAVEREQEFRDLFSPRRGRSSSSLYYTSMLTFFAGDGTAVALPLIAYGEIPLLAVLQSTGSAAAMVVAGWVGREMKDHRSAAARSSPRFDRPEDYDRVAGQLRGTARFPLGAVLIASAIALLVPTGIGLIRYSVEPAPSYALAFVLLALGTCLASGIASYCYANAEADHLNGLVRDTKKKEKKAARFRSNKVIAKHAAAKVAAASITSERRDAGLAAAHQVAANSHDNHGA